MGRGWTKEPEHLQTRSVCQFTSREEFVQTIENYIADYNNRRVQRNPGVLMLMEKHSSCPFMIQNNCSLRFYQALLSRCTKRSILI